MPSLPARWSPEEDSRLMELKAEGWSYMEIGRALGRSEGSCRSRLYILQKNEGKAPPDKGARPWTEEEYLFLRKNYGRLDGKACAKLLDRSVEAVRTKVQRLGLKSTSRIEREAEERAPAPKLKKRRCHDCGRVTSDYRCQRCWEKLRKEYADEI